MPYTAALRVLKSAIGKPEYNWIYWKFAAPIQAGVAELADARDSKSRDLHWSCGFDLYLRYYLFFNNLQRISGSGGQWRAMSPRKGAKSPCQMPLNLYRRHRADCTGEHAE